MYMDIQVTLGIITLVVFNSILNFLQMELKTAKCKESRDNAGKEFCIGTLVYSQLRAKQNHLTNQAMKPLSAPLKNFHLIMRKEAIQA